MAPFQKIGIINSDSKELEKSKETKNPGNN